MVFASLHVHRGGCFGNGRVPGMASLPNRQASEVAGHHDVRPLVRGPAPGLGDAPVAEVAADLSQPTGGGESLGAHRLTNVLARYASVQTPIGAHRVRTRNGASCGNGWTLALQLIRQDARRFGVRACPFSKESPRRKLRCAFARKLCD